MVLLPCWLHGKTLRLQSDELGKQLGEYCFDCSVPCVSYEECLECSDPKCGYGFNLPALLENKQLRQRVLNYLYDATLDDELLLEGIIPDRQLFLRQGKERGKFYSKTCYDKKTGKKLMSLDEKRLKKWRESKKLSDKFSATISEAKPLPPRVVKRKGEGTAR